MIHPEIASGVVHEIPDDLKEILTNNEDLLLKWNSLTSLARNEWICWLISVKRDDTRKKHLLRLCEDLRKGKRRPCCWAGCPHHNPNTTKWHKNME